MPEAGSLPAPVTPPLPVQPTASAPALVAPRRRLPIPRLACWALAALALGLLFASDAWWMTQARALREAASQHFGGAMGRTERDLLQLPARGSLSLTLAALILLFDRRRSRAPLLLAVALAVGVTGWLAKGFFGRERPAQAVHRTGAYGTLFTGPRHGFKSGGFQSFPSGHADGAGANAVALSAFYPAWTPLFWSIAVVSSTERVYHEKHFPSDVLAGLLLAQGLGGTLVRSPRLIALCQRLARERGSASAAPGS